MSASTRWTYGDSWERYPIEPGEVWLAGGGRVAVHNLFDPLPAWVRADLLFVDPPWDLGNINSFYTKAGRSDYLSRFDVFLDALFARIGEAGPRVCYIEMGRRNADEVRRRLAAVWPVVQRWDVAYYRKHPCVLLRGGHTPTADDYTGIDEAKCIELVAQRELPGATMGDLCMGRGLVGLAAHAAGRPFVGTELNRRRLACLLDRLARRGADVVRHS